MLEIIICLKSSLERGEGRRHALIESIPPSQTVISTRMSRLSDYEKAVSCVDKAVNVVQYGKGKGNKQLQTVQRNQLNQFFLKKENVILKN